MSGRFLFISLLLNAALATAIISLPGKTKTLPESQRGPAVEKAPLPIVADPIVTTITNATTTKTFVWSDIVSTNYGTFAKNLRNIGCPETTVSDIISGEIDDWFVRERRALLDPIQPQFWQLLAQGRDKILPDDIDKKLDALNERREEMRKDALKQHESAKSEEEDVTTDFESTLDNKSLSSDVVQKLRDLEKEKNKIQSELNKKNKSEDERNTLKTRLKELAQLQRDSLPPEKLAEYDLKKSSFASSLSELFGFEASPEELQTIARLKMDEAKRTNPPNGSAQTNHSEANAAIRELLGERYAAYERAANPEFAALWKVGQRFGLSEQALNAALEVRTAQVREEERLNKDKSLTKEQRETELDRVWKQSRSALKELLGPEAVRALE